LPDDPRVPRPDALFIVVFHHDVDNVKKGGVLLGPTAILWDVLEYVPEIGDAGFWIVELVGKTRTRIFRWHPGRELWKRVARGRAAE